MTTLRGIGDDGSAHPNDLKIDHLGRALTRAVAEDELADAVKRERAFTLVSSYSSSNGEEVIAFTNDGKDIKIQRIGVTVDTNSIISVMHMTNSSTLAGTPITAKNYKFGRAKMADLTAFGNASVTGGLDGDILDSQLVTTAGWGFLLSGLIVPRDETLFVRSATAGVINVTVHLYRTEED